jgi:predicted nucleotidyltransferase
MRAKQPLQHLSAAEQQCARAYVRQLAERLGDNLLQIWLYGSAARGDMWPNWMPLHSDIDLLILTRDPVAKDVQEELITATYPLFLQCGRQLSPQFRTVLEFDSPPSDRARQFFDRVRAEGQRLDER